MIAVELFRIVCPAASGSIQSDAGLFRLSKTRSTISRAESRSACSSEDCPHNLPVPRYAGLCIFRAAQFPSTVTSFRAGLPLSQAAGLREKIAPVPRTMTL